MRTPAVRIAILVLALLAPGIAKADRGQIESVLKSEYQNKVVILRRFYSDAKLRFDSTGRPVGKVEQGYWTSDGMLRIADVLLDQKHVLHLGAIRIVNEFDNKTGGFRKLATKRSVQIEVDLDPSWQETEPVQQLLGKILSSDMKDLLDTIPDYWQWCMVDGIYQDTTGTWRCGKPGMAETATGPKFTLPDGRVVYRAGNGTNPPKLVLSPDPSYTEIANAIRYQGVSTLWIVVDEAGNPTQIHILRPVGVGLDDKGVEAVRKWRFRPATLDGRPVAVQVDVEVNFRCCPTLP
jgi:TonB family protein